MRAALLLSIIVLSAYVSFSKMSEAKPACTLCSTEEECEQTPESCEYGIVKDSCNRKVCAKGPGTRCGGVLGECGGGMWCHNDDKCHGCSIYTYKCYPAAAS